jgi:hypothetical protein
LSSCSVAMIDVVTRSPLFGHLYSSMRQPLWSAYLRAAEISGERARPHVPDIHRPKAVVLDGGNSAALGPTSPEGVSSLAEIKSLADRARPTRLQSSAVKVDGERLTSA